MSSGKKPKQNGKQNAKQSIPNKHAYQRINYLYQASHILLSQRLHLDAPPPPPPNPMAIAFLANSTRPSTTLAASTLNSTSRALNATLRTISQRMQIRLNPEIKHTLCRNCNSLLTTGTDTCTTGLAQKDTVLEVTCKSCERVKRFPLTGKSTAEERAAEAATFSDRKKKQKARLRRRKTRIKAQVLEAKKSISAKAI